MVLDAKEGGRRAKGKAGRAKGKERTRNPATVQIMPLFSLRALLFALRPLLFAEYLEMVVQHLQRKSAGDIDCLAGDAAALV
jgi:hypothetical protein